MSVYTSSLSISSLISIEIDIFQVRRLSRQGKFQNGLQVKFQTAGLYLFLTKPSSCPLFTVHRRIKPVNKSDTVDKPISTWSCCRAAPFPTSLSRPFTSIWHHIISGQSPYPSSVKTLSQLRRLAHANQAAGSPSRGV